MIGQVTLADVLAMRWDQMGRDGGAN